MNAAFLLVTTAWLAGADATPPAAPAATAAPAAPVVSAAPSTCCGGGTVSCCDTGCHEGLLAHLRA